MNKIEDKTIVSLALEAIVQTLDHKRGFTLSESARKYFDVRLAEVRSIDELNREAIKSLYNLVSNVFHVVSSFGGEPKWNYAGCIIILGDIKEQLLDRLEIQEVIEVEEV